jgi:hypothetical protein
MSERNTNFDQATTETEGTVDPQTRQFEMPSCCGPMMERMMKRFGGATEEDGKGHENSVLAGLPDCCRSMMAQMMKACAGPQQREGESPDETQERCCEPG